MPSTAKISPRQLTILAAIITVGDSILILPSIPTYEAKMDAWISAMIGLAVGLLVIQLFVTAGKLNPKLTLVELNEHIFGKWFGTTISLLFLAYGLLSISAHLREIGDFSVSQTMPDTPIEAIHILLLFIMILAVRLGLETFTRLAEIIFPWFILFFLIFTISLLPAIDINKIQPVFDNGIKPILRGSISSIAFPFMELVVLMMIFPNVNNASQIRRSMSIGALIGGIILFIIITLTILVVGAEPASRSMYPSYDLAKRINIGEFFQRIEVALALVWVLTTYFKLTVYLYVFSRGLAQILRLKDYRMLLLPTGMIIVVLTLAVAPNISFYNDYTDKYWPFLDTTFSVFLPLLLLAGYAVRKKMKSSH
ncbi:endospore germination permease [Cohnella sp. WQ 127256]|uniref:GerAB/ArcD/ProY family transporter n=1 Tax=Cohnella sp. WQ 127256 TaxID=2938790 RepID=UPI002117F579|nr:endospore germination permease [Cohnella sp. WQ 127256]